MDEGHCTRDTINDELPRMDINVVPIISPWRDNSGTRLFLDTCKTNLKGGPASDVRVGLLGGLFD